MQGVEQAVALQSSLSLGSWELQESVRSNIAKYLATRDLVSVMLTCRSLRDTLTCGLDDVWHSAAEAVLPHYHPPLRSASQAAVTAVLNSAILLLATRLLLAKTSALTPCMVMHAYCPVGESLKGVMRPSLPSIWQVTELMHRPVEEEKLAKKAPLRSETLPTTKCWLSSLHLA